MKIGLIVEGRGEVSAAPVLLRRLAEGLRHANLEIPQPLRVPRSKLVLQPELRRAVELMARKAGPEGPILIMLDSDDDCPAQLGPRLLSWAREQRADREVAVVLAHKEFENWFLAAAKSLRGHRGLAPDVEPPPKPEEIRGAKEWLAQRMANGYSPTIDQLAFAAIIDLEQARTCRSFDKLVRVFTRFSEVARNPQ